MVDGLILAPYFTESYRSDMYSTVYALWYSVHISGAPHVGDMVEYVL